MGMVALPANVSAGGYGRTLPMLGRKQTTYNPSVDLRKNILPERPDVVGLLKVDHPAETGWTWISDAGTPKTTLRLTISGNQCDWAAEVCSQNESIPESEVLQQCTFKGHWFGSDNVAQLTTERAG